MCVAGFEAYLDAILYCYLNFDGRFKVVLEECFQGTRLQGVPLGEITRPMVPDAFQEMIVAAPPRYLELWLNVLKLAKGGKRFEITTQVIRIISESSDYDCV